MTVILTPSQVKAIRRSYARTKQLPTTSKARVSYRYLARQYGVTFQQIARIVKRECWKKVYVKRTPFVVIENVGNGRLTSIFPS